MRRVMLYMLACVLFWLSYLQFVEIQEKGVLRSKFGYVLDDWTMYLHALVPALLAGYAIWTDLRKNNTRKGEK